MLTFHKIQGEKHDIGVELHFSINLNEVYLDSQTIYLSLCLAFNIKPEIARKKLSFTCEV